MFLSLVSSLQGLANAQHNQGAKSQFNLEQMYRKGQGVTQDDVQAAKCYRKAA